ncbi:tRNA (5-methylaminomethyl-2-thiouridine)(34)-methyltransferase MnmD [Flavobacterium branchiophilum]|uniref:MnmC-like methyltransferase domain-containing protein n=2 Tax=Flavobacterium branchiophilum TaxID=55197 RepID=G2Z2W1_FLABF|nr:tRNA (5-methylaminomethyl-2-thiouridine)(34)-methyltransferase MnmD [Flavobacterium branchiophilum]PDS23741.1 SAM-dependent methyltransferase [Flavobacterium branchiophilum]CCB70290.1 Protein of unknown function [Flavobacterium branchiophilum FL-15]
MKREVILTNDGSSTIHIPEWNESYHSKHGAIQEAYHVFIKNGLDLFEQQQVAILEIGFGTGLNALITLLEANKRQQNISYQGVEAYPILESERQQLNYDVILESTSKKVLFDEIHRCKWEEEVTLSPYFCLKKRQDFFENIQDISKFDLIYFDAFGYRVQPELWRFEIFEKMYQALHPEGVLVTYAARSIIKKNMEQAGFRVEKHPGAPGKRELFRAIKEVK